MKIISHRGNLEGSSPSTENTPKQIDKCISLGLAVEVDVHYDWATTGRFFLGHDEPTVNIPVEFLLNRADSLYVHAKTIETVDVLMNIPKLEWFFHNKDLMTLTSKGRPWTNQVYVAQGIIVCLGPYIELKKQPFGICTDHPLDWMERSN